MLYLLRKLEENLGSTDPPRQPPATSSQTSVAGSSGSVPGGGGGGDDSALENELGHGHVPGSSRTNNSSFDAKASSAESLTGRSSVRSRSPSSSVQNAGRSGGPFSEGLSTESLNGVSSDSLTLADYLNSIDSDSSLKEQLIEEACSQLTLGTESAMEAILSHAKRTPRGARTSIDSEVERVLQFRKLRRRAEQLFSMRALCAVSEAAALQTLCGHAVLLHRQGEREASTPPDSRTQSGGKLSEGSLKHFDYEDRFMNLRPASWHSVALFPRLAMRLTPSASSRIANTLKTIGEGKAEDGWDENRDGQSVLQALYERERSALQVLFAGTSSERPGAEGVGPERKDRRSTVVDEGRFLGAYVGLYGLEDTKRRGLLNPLDLHPDPAQNESDLRHENLRFNLTHPAKSDFDTYKSQVASITLSILQTWRGEEIRRSMSAETFRRLVALVSVLCHLMSKSFDGAIRLKTLASLAAALKVAERTPRTAQGEINGHAISPTDPRPLWRGEPLQETVILIHDDSIYIKTSQLFTSAMDSGSHPTEDGSQAENVIENENGPDTFLNATICYMEDVYKKVATETEFIESLDALADLWGFSLSGPTVLTDLRQSLASTSSSEGGSWASLPRTESESMADSEAAAALKETVEAAVSSTLNYSRDGKRLQNESRAKSPHFEETNEKDLEDLYFPFLRSIMHFVVHLRTPTR